MHVAECFLLCPHLTLSPRRICSMCHIFTWLWQSTCQPNPSLTPFPCALRSGSHFDEYVAEYLAFKPGAPPSAAFNPPPECAGVAAEKAPSPRPFALRMAALMPSTARIGGIILWN